MLSRQQGLTYPEIAEMQGLSVKTVEVRIARALKTMRSYLRLHGGGILGMLLAWILEKH